MGDVADHGQSCELGDGGGVAGAAHEGERERAEHERLAASGEPVSGLGDAEAYREKRRHHDQEAVTGQPHEPGSRIEDGVPHRAWLERRLGAALEDCRSYQQPDDPRADRREHQHARPGHDCFLPPARERSDGRAGEKKHEERAHQQDAGKEMDPQRGDEEPAHSILNENPPSVTSASIESTRHITVYVPGGNDGSVARSTEGLERSTRLSPRSTCWPRSFTTRPELYAGSRRSEN